MERSASAHRHRLYGQVPRAGVDRVKTGVRRRARHPPRRAVRGDRRPARRAPPSSALRALPPTGATSSPTPRSTSSRSPRPTRCMREMAIAALQAGKHVWCEKPMAPKLADAERMAEAARRSGKSRSSATTTSRARRSAHRGLLDAGAIGTVNHLRIEMDEDFMADPEQPHSWRSEASAGYGALDDFAVHPLSLIATLLGRPESVFGEMSKPYPDRPHGRRPARRRDLRHRQRAVAPARRHRRRDPCQPLRLGPQGPPAGADFRRARDDRLRSGAVQRSAGLSSPKGRPPTRASAPPDGPGAQALRPLHRAAGHQMGFNDLKIIECHDSSRASAANGRMIDFAAGLKIERTVDAMARSDAAGPLGRDRLTPAGSAASLVGESSGLARRSRTRRADRLN